MISTHGIADGWRWLRLAAIRLAAYALSAYLIVGAVFYFTQDGILFTAPKAFDKTVPRVPYEDLRILVKGTEYSTLSHKTHLPCNVLEPKCGGLLFEGHKTPLTRRFVVYYCSAVYMPWAAYCSQ